MQCVMMEKNVCLFWAKAHLKQTGAKWETVQWSEESKFGNILEIMDIKFSALKNRGTIQLVMSALFKRKASLMVLGCISAYGTGDLHIYKGSINAERYIHTRSNTASVTKA